MATSIFLLLSYPVHGFLSYLAGRLLSDSVDIEAKRRKPRRKEATRKGRLGCCRNETSVGRGESGVLKEAMAGMEEVEDLLPPPRRLT
jgi:hypothetical protein